jgi:signal transduction histidine kinase
VGIRTRLFLIFTVFGIIPMVAMCAVIYSSGARAVESEMRRDLNDDANHFAREVESLISDRTELLKRLIASGEFKNFLARRDGDNPTKSVANGTPAKQDTSFPVPDELRRLIQVFFENGNGRFTALTLFGPSRDPILDIRPRKSATESSGHDLRFETRDFPKHLIKLDENVWGRTPGEDIPAVIVREPYGVMLRYSVPLISRDALGGVTQFALLFESAAGPMFEEAGQSQSEGQFGSKPGAQNRDTATNFIVLNRDRMILFASNVALLFQSADTAMPATFGKVSSLMTSGNTGTSLYNATGGTTWVAAFNQIKGVDVSVAAIKDLDSALMGTKRTVWVSLLVALILGLIIASLVSHTIRRTTRSIQRVTEGAVAIAGGKLDQRIEVTSSDETKLLAESFNRMSDRLKEQIAREAESKQFESFMRLSAMLTHDLKNAISGLSLLVGNMEKQFHREDFRRDAMRSLIDSTEKLSGLVAKLRGPVQSLSGEHQRPRATDLVPLLKAVVAAHVVPRSSHFDVKMKLPEELIAQAEPDRIEKVIENLVINAVEAMGSRGGILSIQAGRTPDDKVYFKISDGGKGMTAEFVRTRLFRAFSTTKRDGIGLGLYTSREIVKAHGGTIEVESAPNSGTTFCVVLPSASKT